MKRYGPYKSSGGHLFWIDVDGSKRKSVWVHRELMEKKLGRKLKKTEVVHHKDEKPDHNAVSNFELKTRRTHAQAHAKGVEMLKFDCPVCGRAAEKVARFVRHNRKQGKPGPFCSRKCAGKWISKQSVRVMER